MMKRFTLFADIDWFFHTIIDLENQVTEIESEVLFNESGKLIGIIFHD